MGMKKSQFRSIPKQQSQFEIDDSQSPKSFSDLNHPSVFSQHSHIDTESLTDIIVQKWTNKSFRNKFLVLVLIIAIFVVVGIILKNKSQSSQQSYGKKKISQDEKKWLQQQQALQRECTRAYDMRTPLFFIYLDKQDMTTFQAHKFFNMNGKICKFHVLYENDFQYLVDYWNFREQLVTSKKQFINKTTLKRQDRKTLLIFLKLYFWGGIYLHPSFGLKFGDLISERFYLNARVGRQILFAQADNKNEKDIVLPKRNFKAVRAEHNFSERVQKMIRKIIARQDWMEVCQGYQCMIMKDAIKQPENAIKQP